MSDTQQPTDFQQPTSLVPRATSAIAVPEDPLLLGEYARCMLGLPELDAKGNKNAHVLAGKILTGRELGIPAMAAAREIFIIQGAPTVSAKMQLALVRASPRCVTFKIHPVMPEGGDLVVKAEAERSNGDRQAITLRRSEFQHLLGKDNWKQYPKRMLTARAITYVVRDLFSDVVVGIETTEERQDDLVEVQYHVEPVRPLVGASPIIEHPAQAAQPVEPMKQPEAPKPSPISQTPVPPATQSASPVPEAQPANPEAPKTTPTRKPRQTRKNPPGATPVDAMTPRSEATAPAQAQAAPTEEPAQPTPAAETETPEEVDKNQEFINFDDPEQTQ